ncbi:MULTISPECIES: activator-dependent family glycosyltransferase [Streptomycetaceae]|uniref:activator-dependent family glycosyltransferase n=1 Tax=Streptomycetaceae TaxID=2062 RepID=UPI00093ED1C7|nr:activator-dependent family glycosyltransferase [Streptomyces sp. CB02056]OKI06983.1 hypothetical protein AMK13_16505 [Streptomyces sp. CB02056]
MRVLFVTAPFRSHLYVQTPLAWALRTAGHEVRVACSPRLTEDVVRTGLTPVPIGEEVDLGDLMARSEPERAPAAPAGGRKSHQSDYPLGDPTAELASNAAGWRTLFNPDSSFDDLVAFAELWRPDLVVSDTFVLSGAPAARRVGAAHARMLFGADGLGQLRTACRAQWRAQGSDWDGVDPLREWLEPVFGRFGVEFDEEAVLGQWTVFPMPTWVWRPAGIPYVPMRHVPFNGPSATPSWVYRRPERRRVCFTLGLAHREGRGHGVSASPREVFEAIADLDVEVVATLAPGQLPPGLRVPDNVRVVDFVPLNDLLPTCAAVIHSGGAGAFAAAVEHAVPQLIVPNVYWSEKWWGPVAMASGLEEQGAGRYVADADGLTGELLRSELRRVLEDPAFREGAARVSAQSAALPSPHDLVPVLEGLTAKHRYPA